MGYVTPLYGLIAPFILWPIEYYFPQPFIFEEIVKGIIIYFIVKEDTSRKSKITQALLFGFLFSLSETVLYLFNIYQMGNINTLFVRFILTTPLHMLTCLIIVLLGMKNKWLMIVGVILTGFIHLIFNASILTLTNFSL